MAPSPDIGRNLNPSARSRQTLQPWVPVLGSPSNRWSSFCFQEGVATQKRHTHRAEITCHKAVFCMSFATTIFRFRYLNHGGGIFIRVICPVTEMSFIFTGHAAWDVPHPRPAKGTLSGVHQTGFTFSGVWLHAQAFLLGPLFETPQKFLPPKIASAFANSDASKGPHKPLKGRMFRCSFLSMQAFWPTASSWGFAALRLSGCKRHLFWGNAY